jgi:hypothetical protein
MKYLILHFLIGAYSYVSCSGIFLMNVYDGETFQGCFINVVASEYKSNQMDDQYLFQLSENNKEHVLHKKCFQAECSEKANILFDKISVTPLSSKITKKRAYGYSGQSVLTFLDDYVVTRTNQMNNNSQLTMEDKNDTKNEHKKEDKQEHKKEKKKEHKKKKEQKTSFAKFYEKFINSYENDLDFMIHNFDHINIFERYMEEKDHQAYANGDHTKTTFTVNFAKAAGKERSKDIKTLKVKNKKAVPRLKDEINTNKHKKTSEEFIKEFDKEKARSSERKGNKITDGAMTQGGDEVIENGLTDDRNKRPQSGVAGKETETKMGIIKVDSDEQKLAEGRGQTIQGKGNKEEMNGKDYKEYETKIVEKKAGIMWEHVKNNDGELHLKNLYKDFDIMTISGKMDMKLTTEEETTTNKTYLVEILVINFPSKNKLDNSIKTKNN